MIFSQDAGLITFSNALNPNQPQYRSSCSTTLFGGAPTGGFLFGATITPASATGSFGSMNRGRGFVRSFTQPIVKPVIRKEFPETWIWESIER